MEVIMKTLLVAASAIGLLASAPVYAQSVKTVTVSGSVTGACGLGNHKSGASEAPGWAQGDIDLGEMAGADGKLDIDPANLSQRSFGNVWCNGPADVTIEVSALTNSTAGAPEDSSSFANQFDMKITGSLGGNAFGNGGGGLTVSSSGGTTGVKDDIHTAGAFETGLQQYSGFNLEVLNPGNLRPVAGDYSGTIKLTATIS